jgi:hypothetical protein
MAMIIIYNLAKSKNNIEITANKNATVSSTVVGTVVHGATNGTVCDTIYGTVAVRLAVQFGEWLGVSVVVCTGAHNLIASTCTVSNWLFTNDFCPIEALTNDW